MNENTGVIICIKKILESVVTRIQASCRLSISRFILKVKRRAHETVGILHLKIIP